MKSANIENLRANVQQIKFGILKIISSPILPISQSFIIETHKITDNDFLWCTASFVFPIEFDYEKSFRVSLNYIQKADGLFIKMTGRAKVINPSFNFQDFEKKEPSKGGEKVVLLKIKIGEAHYYKKRSTSPYTSFLQAINRLTFQKSHADARPIS